MSGATMWLTGLPSAGKSTLANALASRLRDEGRRVEVLDGDTVRGWLSADLGYSKRDRDANVLRIGNVAQLLARNDVIVLAAVVAPYAATRDAVRANHEAAGIEYLEVHVAAPVKVCIERDVKGLYARQRAGEISGLTGIDDPYEAPESPTIRVETHVISVAECVDNLYGVLAQRGSL
jgi:adenylylsulfate kinase